MIIKQIQYLLLMYIMCHHWRHDIYFNWIQKAVLFYHLQYKKQNKDHTISLLIALFQ